MWASRSAPPPPSHFILATGLLLRVVQNLLERNDDVEQGRQSCQDEAGPSASGEQSSTRGEVVKNLRNLFASYSAASRSQSSRPPPAKRQKSLYVPKETWTHEFFCLADCARVDAPSRKEKLELQFAGLGRKKIVFGSKDSALQVKTNWRKNFQSLKTEVDSKFSVVVFPLESL